MHNWNHQRLGWGADGGKSLIQFNGPSHPIPCSIILLLCGNSQQAAKLRRSIELEIWMDEKE
jgi:hypothetical protein